MGFSHPYFWRVAGYLFRRRWSPESPNPEGTTRLAGSRRVQNIATAGHSQKARAY